MHPLPHPPGPQAEDPQSFAAEHILSTLAENKKWLNQMEETDQTSMRMFEYISLFFLVFLLKFMTDSTREIYVRLTSPVRFACLVSSQSTCARILNCDSNQQCPSPLRPASPADSPIASPMPTIARTVPLGSEERAASEDDDPLCFPRPHRLGPIAKYTPRQARPSTPTDLEGIDFYFKSPPLTPLRSSLGRNARGRRLSDEVGGGRSPSVESMGSARGKVSLACSIALLCAAFSRLLLPAEYHR